MLDASVWSPLPLRLNDTFQRTILLSHPNDAVKWLTISKSTNKMIETNRQKMLRRMDRVVFSVIIENHILIATTQSLPWTYEKVGVVMEDEEDEGLFDYRDFRFIRVELKLRDGNDENLAEKQQISPFEIDLLYTARILERTKSRSTTMMLPSEAIKRINDWYKIDCIRFCSLGAPPSGSLEILRHLESVKEVRVCRDVRCGKEFLDMLMSLHVKSIRFEDYYKFEAIFHEKLAETELEEAHFYKPAFDRTLTPFRCLPLLCFSKQRHGQLKPKDLRRLIIVPWAEGHLPKLRRLECALDMFDYGYANEEILAARTRVRDDFLRGIKPVSDLRGDDPKFVCRPTWKAPSLSIRAKQGGSQLLRITYFYKSVQGVVVEVL